MSRPSRQNDAIRTFILRSVSDHPKDIAALVASEFAVTRVTANRYLQRLVDDELLTADGVTRGRTYALRDFVKFSHFAPLTSDVKEDEVYRVVVEPHLTDLPANVRDICQYGFNEMMNNIIDHSDSPDFVISFKRNAERVKITLTDEGVGIFEKIRAAQNLGDVRDAILELSKGKLTTDPNRHSGEGIFFTSRMCECFSILSSGLFYQYQEVERQSEWLLETSSNEKVGTTIALEIPTDAAYTVTDIFKRYEDDENRFSRTHVPVRLARYGEEQLVSRSQARRVLARFNRFSEVILDFEDVATIGQAFADEIFRVYANQHPEVIILPVQTSEAIDAMIRHVKRA